MTHLSIKNATITINVSNLDRSIDCYKTLGFILEKRWGERDAEMIAPGMIIGLHPIRGKPQISGSGNTSIGFTCDDYEKVKPLLTEKSISSSERNKEGGKFIHFQYPEDTSLYFIEPKG